MRCPTMAATDAALIAGCHDEAECRGIERESDNNAAILPQPIGTSRAALPHPFCPQGAVDDVGRKAFRRLSRIAVAGTLNAL